MLIFTSPLLFTPLPYFFSGYFTFFPIKTVCLLSICGYVFAIASNGFSFFAIGGLFNVLTTLPLIMREVTLFLK